MQLILSIAQQHTCTLLTVHCNSQLLARLAVWVVICGTSCVTDSASTNKQVIPKLRWPFRAFASTNKQAIRKLKWLFSASASTNKHVIRKLKCPFSLLLQVPTSKWYENWKDHSGILQVPTVMEWYINQPGPYFLKWLTHLNPTGHMSLLRSISHRSSYFFHKKQKVRMIRINYRSIVFSLISPFSFLLLPPPEKKNRYPLLCICQGHELKSLEKKKTRKVLFS